MNILCKLGLHDDMYKTTIPIVATRRGPFDPRENWQLHEVHSIYVCARCGKETDYGDPIDRR